MQAQRERLARAFAERRAREATDVRGEERAHEARLLAAERLQARLDLQSQRDQQARERVEATVARLAADARQAGDAVSDAQALEDIEAAIETSAARSAQRLDVLAEVRLRLGKMKEAKEAIRERLVVNPNSRAAYEKLLDLESKSGEKRDLDTFMNGKKVTFNVRPKIESGRTLMPLRALVESMNAEIEWEDSTKTITIYKDDQTIKLQIGSNIALINGQEVLLEVPAAIEDSRTLVPARFVSEGLGLYVTWLAEQRSIVVTAEPVEEDGE